MAENAAANLSAGALRLLVLLSCGSFKLCAGTDSVHCSFDVQPATKPRQHWCQGSCSVNGKSLFQLDNKNQVIPFSKMIMEEKATEVCADFPQSVINILEEIRDQLRNMELEQIKTMGSKPLQVTMKSQYNQGQLADTFCNFTINGQSSFSFNPTKDTWTGSSPDGDNTMRPWERNRELGQGLRRLLTGDFSHCYKESLTVWRETPRSTIKGSAIIRPTSGTQSHNMAFVVILCIAGLIFIKLVT